MFEKAKRWATPVVAGVAGAAAACAPAFASATVTAEQLSSITTDLSANVAVILPVGITIMGVLIGVSLIPRLLYKFF